jgi:hypothetical protein
LNLLPHRASIPEEGTIAMGREQRRTGRLMGLLAWNGTMGLGFGVLFATLLVAVDAHGLGTLMGQTIGVMAGWALLAGLFGVAFAAIAAGTAVMCLGEDGDRPPVLREVRIRASSRRRRL